MPTEFFTDDGMLVDAEGNSVDYIRGAFDARRYIYPPLKPMDTPEKEESPQPAAGLLASVGCVLFLVCMCFFAPMPPTQASYERAQMRGDFMPGLSAQSTPYSAICDWWNWQRADRVQAEYEASERRAGREPSPQASYQVFKRAQIGQKP